MATMRAVQITKIIPEEKAALDDLHVSIVPRPACGESQIEVRVKAAGTNFYDILQLQGKYQFKPPLPFIPGAEFAGVVSKVGSKAQSSGYKVGDRVYGSGGSLGAYAEYLVASPKSVWRIPKGMSFEQASMFSSGTSTSWAGIVLRAKTQPGEYVLVHAAAGGVGLPAVQIAKALGAIVIGTVGSDHKVKAVREAGADYVINYTKTPKFAAKVKEITKRHGADVVYDPVGGDAFDESTRCMAWNGRLIVCGFTSGRIPSIKANRILLKGISIMGLFYGAYGIHEPHVHEQARNETERMFLEGKLDPKIYNVYPLEDLKKGLSAIANRQSYGKVVISLDTTPGSKL